MARRRILFAALIFTAIIVGGQYVVWWDYDPGGMSAAFYTEKMQHAIRVIGPPLFSVQILAAILAMTSAFLARDDRPSFDYLIGASACCVAGVLLTVFGNIPILNQIATWSISAPPPDWNATAIRWWWIHSVRFGVQIIAMLLVVLAAFRHGRTRSSPSTSPPA